MKYEYISPSAGDIQDDDPDYASFVLWATVCFLFTLLGMVLTYCACYYCKQVQPTTVECGPVPCLESLCGCEDDKVLRGRFVLSTSSSQDKKQEA